MLHIGRKITCWLNRQARIKQTVRELSVLTDRELHDLGISRSDIYRIARSAANV